MANDEGAAEWAERSLAWVRNERTFDAVFAPITFALVAAAAFASEQRVLDVGCGTGTLLAAAAGVGARVTGVDIAEPMVEAARRRVPSATVVLGDAQTADLTTSALGGPFDRIVSRFGVMFFADPVVAFGNIRRAAAAGARLTFACWRRADENPMFALGQDVLTARLGESAVPVDGAVGPVAFADPLRVRAVLTSAGWQEITVDPLDGEADYGFGGDDGVDARLATVLATSTGHRARTVLEARLGPDGWAEVVDDVRAELRRHLVDGTVRFPLATWLVQASA